MSTPATARPIVFAARFAVERSSGVSFTFSAVPPRWMLERNSPGAARRSIAAIDAVADDEGADVGALRLLDELLHEDVGVELAEGADHRLRRLPGLGEDDALALGALESSLTTTGAPPTVVEDAVDVLDVVGEAGDRQADAGAGEQLQLAQLVVGAVDRLRLVRGEDMPIISNWRTTEAP